MKFFWFLLTGTIFAAVLACSKPTLIGSELLEGERTDVAFTDQFDLRMSTVTEDSVRTWSQNSFLQLTTYLCGQLDDPFAGKSSAELYLQPTISGNAVELLNQVIDSVVFVLRYDTLGNYGSFEEPVDIELFRMLEIPDDEIDHYASESFMTDVPPIGQKLGYIPAPFDSITLNEPSDTSIVPPQLRIRMDDVFAQSIANQDSSVMQRIDSFITFLNGINVRMTSASNTMLGFNIGSIYSGLTVYYEDTAGVKNKFQFIYSPTLVNMARYTHDFAGSFAGEIVNVDGASDSLFLVQSMAGLNGSLEVNGLDDLGDILINHAELELFVAELPEDDTLLYDPPARMITRTQTSEEERLRDAIDVILALSLGDINRFGGQLESDVQPKRYTLPVTAVLQSIQNGTIQNKIFISSYRKANFPERAILYGPGHSDFPARIKLTYTRL